MTDSKQPVQNNTFNNLEILAYRQKDLTFEEVKIYCDIFRELIIKEFWEKISERHPFACVYIVLTA